MRKGLILFTLLAVASVLFLFCGAAAIHEGRDDITVTEVTLAGDPAAAAGLHTQVVLNEDRRLFWTTDYDVSSQPQSETVFAYHQRRQSNESGEYKKNVHFSLGSAGYGASGILDLEGMMAESNGLDFSDNLLLPVVDLASRLGAGESRTEVVDLHDYYEYYPVDLLCMWAGMENVEEVHLAHQAFLNDYFRIPIPKGTQVEVSVTKNNEGQVIDILCNSYYPSEENGDHAASGDAYTNTASAVVADAYTYNDSVVFNNALYLLIYGTHDYSQIKGGYGLYRIPISYRTEYENTSFSRAQEMIEIEQIENVYPLPADNSANIRMAQGANDETLLLFELREDHVTVIVLDTATHQVRQEIDLNTDVLPNVWYHENLVILGTTDYGTPNGRLQVLRYEEGVYELWLDDAFYPLNDEGYFYFEPVFYFDGERLAMAAFLAVYEKASHRLVVYDKTGLLYAGDYLFNTDDLTAPLKNYNWDEPLKLLWK